MTTAMATGPVEVSAQFLNEARNGGGGAERRQLAALTRDELAAALPDDASRLAFWINLYNANIQYLLRTNPDAYGHRARFFAKRQIVVARKRLSFNDIEHGILRRSMFGYSLGYVANPFPSRFERRFRLERRDFRVHFALNCGARSCPAVAPLTAEGVGEQLERTTHDYLLAESDFDQSANFVRVPRILSWFRGDFGGKRGILELLRKHEVIPNGAHPDLKFRGYDWTLALDRSS